MSRANTRPPQQPAPAVPPRPARVQRVQPVEALSAWRVGARDAGSLAGLDAEAEGAASLTDTAAVSAVQRPSAAARAGARIDEAPAADFAAALLTMVEHLAKFCLAPSVAERGLWTMLLPLPLAGLEETSLRMEMSPAHVQLRFETEHAPSRALLRECTPVLADALRLAMADGRGVEVLLW